MADRDCARHPFGSLACDSNGCRAMYGKIFCSEKFSRRFFIAGEKVAARKTEGARWMGRARCGSRSTRQPMVGCPVPSPGVEVGGARGISRDPSDPWRREMGKQTSGFKSDVLAIGSVALKDLNVVSMRPRLSGNTGSALMNHSGKVSIEVGGELKPFQVSINITLSHSKPGDPARIPQADIDAFLAIPPQTLKMLRLEDAKADARVFNNGKVGFYFNGKNLVDGKSCQVGCSVVAVGSQAWDDQRPMERPGAEIR
jgi:hypothetical protein